MVNTMHMQSLLGRAYLKRICKNAHAVIIDSDLTVSDRLERLDHAESAMSALKIMIDYRKNDVSDYAKKEREKMVNDLMRYEGLWLIT